MSKLYFIESEQNRAKQQELLDKIIPLLSGYTFSQIQQALHWAEDKIKEEYIINLQD